MRLTLRSLVSSATFSRLLFVVRLLLLPPRSDLRIDIFRDDCARFAAEIGLRTTLISLLNYTQPGFYPRSLGWQTIHFGAIIISARIVR